MGPGTLRGIKYLLDCARDHPHRLGRLTTLHCPCFPAPRLAIREDRAVVPVRDALYELADVLEHLALTRAGLKYTVEGEQRGIRALGTRGRGRGRGEDDLAVVPLVWEGDCRSRCVGCELGWEWRTNTDVDADVACA